MKPTCDDPLLLPLDDPSEYTNISSDPFPYFLCCTPTLGIFLDF